MARLPDGDWEAELAGGGLSFAYRGRSLAATYAKAHKWSQGPTRPYLSDEADAVLAGLEAALKAFDALVEKLVAEGLTENELKLLLNGAYFEDLALRVLFGMMRSAVNESATADD